MKWLTKSDYLKFLIHPAYLWMQKHAKDKLPPFDESVQAIVDQGNEIEAVARSLFDDGVVIESLFAESVRETERHVLAGARTIFQASVLTDRRLYARADVMIKNETGMWDLIEIKSATKIKPDYINDLAFQKVAMEEAGYFIARSFVVHINNQYVRRGAIEPEKLFTQVDVTGEVDAKLAQTKRNIDQALQIIARQECPPDDLALANNYYAWRDNYNYIHPNTDAGSIYNLCRLGPDQVREFAKRGVTQMSEIPTDMLAGLKPQQLHQLEAIKAEKPLIHPVKIAHQLNKLHFPLYFFDYETVGPGIPAYDGTRPYAQVPFQYSLHIQNTPGGPLEHKEFLATNSSNPMPNLLDQMQRDIGPEGSVIVWFKGFEMGVNEMMAQIYPEYAEFLRNVNKRVFDLMEVFSNFHYTDARFGGSASIKKVLPVLVPELSYSSLEIQKGDVASRLWHQAALGKMSPEAAEKVYDDLRVYCGQDTLAMVRIYDVLIEASQIAEGAQLTLL